MMLASVSGTIRYRNDADKCEQMIPTNVSDTFYLTNSPLIQRISGQTGLVRKQRLLQRLDK
jgi:hypothetical protein